MKRSRYTLLKGWHKWICLVITILVLGFAGSGIILNHRDLVSGIDLPRSWLPKAYHRSMGLRPTAKKLRQPERWTRPCCRQEIGPKSSPDKPWRPLRPHRIQPIQVASRQKGVGETTEAYTQKRTLGRSGNARRHPCFTEPKPPIPYLSLSRIPHTRRPSRTRRL